MSDPFVAEIRIVGFNFPPRGWAFCNGQILPISQNTALFSLLGTNYGGDGKSTFALPDLQGRAPMHTGQGPGLTLRQIGEQGGQEGVTLHPMQIPSHTHALSAVNAPATATSLQSNLLAVPATDAYAARGLRTPVPMHPATLGNTGGDAPHNNLQPFLALNFVIALQGIYPQRP